MYIDIIDVMDEYLEYIYIFKIIYFFFLTNNSYLLTAYNLYYRKKLSKRIFSKTGPIPIKRIS